MVTLTFNMYSFFKCLFLCIYNFTTTLPYFVQYFQQKDMSSYVLYKFLHLHCLPVSHRRHCQDSLFMIVTWSSPGGKNIQTTIFCRFSVNRGLYQEALFQQIKRERGWNFLAAVKDSRPDPISRGKIERKRSRCRSKTEEKKVRSGFLWKQIEKEDETLSVCRRYN